MAVILLVGLTIVATDAILGLGDYTKYPGVDWSMGVGMSLGFFGLGAVLLGFQAVNPFFYAGLGMILLVAGTMVATDLILSAGKYNKYPPVDWSTSMSLSIASFGLGALVIGGFIMGTLGLGAIAFAAGLDAITLISQSMVDSARILNKGDFRGGPKKEWSEAVGLSISAFSKVYEVLAANSGWFKSGVSVKDMSNAIMTISQGIVDAAKFFDSNNGVFDIAKVPSRDWGENVGSAIKSFVPIFDFVSKNSGIFGADISTLNAAIVGICESIAVSSRIMSSGNYTKYPSTDWVDGTIYSIQKFKELVGMLSFSDGSILGGLKSFVTGTNPLKEAVSNITLLAEAFNKLGDSMGEFSNSIENLDADKLSAIRSLSSNVILLSLMDPDQFGDMMDKLEKKSSIFSQLLKDFDDKKSEGSFNQTIKPKSVGPAKKSDAELLGEKVDKMTVILADIQSVVGSHGTLKTYLNSIKEHQMVGTNKSR